MSYCLLCDNELSLAVSWRYIFGMQEQTVLCRRCDAQMPLIEGVRCRICDRTLNEQYAHKDICFDCTRWESQREWQGVLTKNRSCFSYNQFLKDVVARWKYRGDAVLASIFYEQMREKYQSEFSRETLVVPIPLTDRRARNRGFNQASLLCQGFAEPTEALVRLEDESKQSKKSRKERIRKKQTFQINPSYKNLVQDADIILVDDIYTTGTTIRLAAKQLLAYGAKSVSSLTAIRG